MASGAEDSEDELAGRPLGPAPLVRHGESGHLTVQEEGLAILRQAEAPLHVVFAIGGSRCGKSTASNALVFGREWAANAHGAGFQTGDTFEPVTTGVDVAVRPLRGGGALVVADCEGAFHMFGSAQSARGFGTLGLLAYHLCSVILHVSMGSIDERDIEVLGFLAASASASAGKAAPCPDVDPSLPALEPVSLAPALVLLVNGSRFDLGDAVARKLLKPPEGSEEATSRWSARAAIASGFRGQPALEALPACQHEAYWPKVAALRSRLLETLPMRMPAGSWNVGGEDIADRLLSLIAVLNGEEPSVAALRQPEPATDSLYRCAHLEPLVEDISRRFAAAGAAGEMPSAGGHKGKVAPPGSMEVDDALAEFDRRAAQLTSGGHNGDAGGAVRGGLVAEMRGRLATRLAGINEALALGRKQAEKMRPQRINAARRCPEDLESGPSTPGTPGSRASNPGSKNLAAATANVVEFEESLAEHTAWGERQLAELRAAFNKQQAALASLAQRTAESESRATTSSRKISDRSFERIREAASERSRGTQTQASASNTCFARVQAEIQDLGKSGLPEPRRLAAQLAEVKEGLEAGRLHRQEVGSAAAQALDARLRRMREDVDKEAGAVVALRDAISRRLSVYSEETRLQLEEERRQRKDRYRAMTEVVERLRSQLESSLESSYDGPEATSPISTRYKKALQKDPAYSDLSLSRCSSIGS
eukprot:TRINITY_DN10572_c0_g1_i5.p1 TRINITY_DN10572_c0_g1~~TRINITY_DN10572_c0_g1_i5.p1  ORF type:complete len:723 (-),score=122.85 TRINITY_DN10572_c0_g1_i5:449-2575(-)